MARVHPDDLTFDHGDAMVSMRAPRWCQYCAEELTDVKDVGRNRDYCTDRCRSAARRQRHNGLDRRTGQAFATELHAALVDSGRSTRWLALQLEKTDFAVWPSTLSDWRSGKTVPLDTEHTVNRLLALERLLPTTPGRLVSAYRRTIPPAQRDEVDHTAPRPIGSGPMDLKARLDARGIGNAGKVVVSEGDDSYWIGADGAPVRSEHSSVLWALQPGARRYWLVLTEDLNLPVRVEAGEGCLAGTPVALSGPGYVPGPGYRLLAVPLNLPEELVVGTPRRITYRVHNPPEFALGPVPLPGWGRVVSDPGCRSLRMTLVFEGRLPNDLWLSTWPQRPGRPLVSCLERSHPPHRGRATRTLTKPMPGAYGFQWRWPEPNERAVVPGPEDDR